MSARSTATHKPCRKCGRLFNRSPMDKTVYCPEHRGRGVTKSSTKYTAVECDRCHTVYTSINCPVCMPR